MKVPPAFPGGGIDDPRTQRRKRLLFWLLRPALGLVISFGLLQVNLDYFEAYFYDLHFRLRPSPTPSGQVTLVVMDQKTVSDSKGVPDFEKQEQVLRRILKSKPRAVVYITPLIQYGESEEDVGRAQSTPPGTPDEIAAFLKTAESFPQLYQMTDKMELPGEENKLRLPFPFEHIQVLSGPRTSDSNIFANDGVTRRVLVDFSGEPMGHLKLARLVDPRLGTDNKPLWGPFDVYETKQLYIDFGRPGSLPMFKFETLLGGDTPMPELEGQIVMIGDDLGKSLRSYIRTPYSRDPSAMTYLEMHGNMLETFLRNSAPMTSPRWLDFLSTMLIAMITIHAVLTMRPLRGLAVLLATAGGFFVVSSLAFWPGGFWLPLAHPALAVFICYYFFIPYRLIVENRRSWEYYQKHQLLQQVETLKTNFISMMSHDLKTPIARIQGMTDVIAQDAVVLSSPQREALDHIRQSGDDLLKFISSILDYARIESEGVLLRKEPKDINELLDEVVKKHDFLAKLKNIQLIMELEPLFSISIDTSLMRQVFSNLVENAIKYSPENSKVLISTEERGDCVIIQVADQGAGIAADELPHVFMKFFRSQNAKSSPIKGSGLGLYLAQYFVELHQGRLLAESAVGQGSTFTVELPIQSAKPASETL